MGACHCARYGETYRGAFVDPAVLRQDKTWPANAPSRQSEKLLDLNGPH